MQKAGWGHVCSFPLCNQDLVNYIYSHTLLGWNLYRQWTLNLTAVTQSSDIIFWDLKSCTSLVIVSFPLNSPQAKKVAVSPILYIKYFLSFLCHLTMACLYLCNNVLSSRHPVVGSMPMQHIIFNTCSCLLGKTTHNRVSYLYMHNCSILLFSMNFSDCYSNSFFMDHLKDSCLTALIPLRL